MDTFNRIVTRVTLLGRLAGGETSSQDWADFVEIYGPAVTAWCRRFGCPEPDLPDVLQNVLVKLLHAFKTFRYDPKKRFQSWLKTVTKNTLEDLRRSPQHKLRGSGNSDIQHALENVAAEDDLAAALQTEFERELFEQACKIVRPQVESKTWLAFDLTKHDEITAAAAAEQLGMPLANFYVARSRVIARIRAEVQRMLAELDGDAT